MSTDNDLPSSDRIHVRYLRLLFTALRWLAEDPACRLPLTLALDAAMVAVQVASEGGDVRMLCEETTGWCVDEDDAALIERVAARLRRMVVPTNHSPEDGMN